MAINDTRINGSFFNQTAAGERCKPFAATGTITNQAIVIFAYSLLFLLSLVGNFLVIVIFRRENRRNKTPVNYLIANMAVSDILVPLFTIPRRIQEVYLGWGKWIISGTVGDFLCRIINFAEELSIGVSIETMVLIAFERFWSVMFPMKPPIISSEKTPKIIAISWIFVSLSFSYYFAAYKLAYRDNQPYCQFELPQMFDSWQDLWRADRIFVFVVFISLPCILLVILYTAIIISLYRKKGDFLNNLRTKQQRLRTAKNKRITAMLVVIVAIFFISWTPHYLYFFVHYFSWPPQQRWSCISKHRLYLAAKYMNYLYPALNPFIYYIFNNSYRRGFQDVLCCREQGRSRVSPLQRRKETKC